MTIKCDGKLGNAAGHRGEDASVLPPTLSLGSAASHDTNCLFKFDEGKACADVQAARESIMHHINGGTRPFRFSIQSE